MAVELISKIKPKNNGTFPLVDAEDVAMPDGTRLSDFKGGVTSVNGQTGDVSITVTNGEDGKDGANGKDGISPTIAVSTITGGNRVKITDAKGSTVFDVMNGADGKDGEDGYTPVKGVDYFDGEDGENGKDGYTPVKGVDYFDGSNGADGKDGEDGKDGVSPTISVTTITGGHRVTITDANGTKTFDVMDGADGKDGKDGTNPTDDHINALIAEYINTALGGEY